MGMAIRTDGDALLMPIEEQLYLLAVPWGRAANAMGVRFRSAYLRCNRLNLLRLLRLQQVPPCFGLGSCCRKLSVEPYTPSSSSALDRCEEATIAGVRIIATKAKPIRRLTIEIELLSETWSCNDRTQLESEAPSVTVARPHRRRNSPLVGGHGPLVEGAWPLGNQWLCPKVQNLSGARKRTKPGRVNA